MPKNYDDKKKMLLEELADCRGKSYWRKGYIDKEVGRETALFSLGRIRI